MTAPRVFALLLAFVVLSSGQAFAQKSSKEAEAVLARLRTTYGNVESLRAAFRQTVGGATQSGTVLLQGARYRIETPAQVLATDGETAWLYSRDEGQVLVNDYVEDETAFSPTDFFTRYPDRFHVALARRAQVGGVPHEVLRLTPKEPGAFVESVLLWVRATDGLPTRVEVQDGNGTEMTFELDRIEVNPKLARDAFRFTPPAGVEVVDLRS